jgi:hypothetical protein
LYQFDVAINTNIGLLVDLVKRTEKKDRKGDIQDFAFPNHAGYLTNHKS